MVIKAKDVKEEKGMVVSVEDAGNQLRYFISKVKGDSKMTLVDEIPHIKSTLLAALWIRNNGNRHLTNLTFKGLLSDIVERSVSEEEAVTFRVITGPIAADFNNKTVGMFITEEEFSEICDQKGILDPETWLTITTDNMKIVHTVLGIYVDINE